MRGQMDKTDVPVLATWNPMSCSRRRAVVVAENAAFQSLSLSVLYGRLEEKAELVGRHLL